MAAPATSIAPIPQASVTRHYVHYLTANLLGIVAGLISFPVMTRLLSTHEYGVFGVFETFALIWTALLKLGTQNSIQRFYPVYGIDPDPRRRQQYYASLVQAPALLSLLICAAALALLALAGRFHPIAVAPYLYVALVIGELGVLYSLADNVIRAREMSALSSRVSVGLRYLQMTCVIGMIVFISRTAMGVYLARLLAAGLILVYLLRWTRANCDLNLRAFSPAIFREGITFGLPLVWSEISFILLAFADRLILQHLLGDYAQVGVYVIGYALAMVVGEVVHLSLLPAFVPMANRLYETEGPAAALALQRKLLKVLYYAVAAFGVGLIFVGRDLLVICSGSRNAESARIFQWVGVNYLFYPIFLVAAYGLTLVKRTRVISAVVLASALVNIALNFFMIPRWGIMGAVYATLISYFLMGGLEIGFCPRALRPTPRPGDLLRPAVLGIAMALAAALILGFKSRPGLSGAINPWLRLSLMVLIFAATFAAPMLLIDRDLRREVKEKLRRRKS